MVIITLTWEICAFQNTWTSKCNQYSLVYSPRDIDLFRKINGLRNETNVGFPILLNQCETHNIHFWIGLATRQFTVVCKINECYL